MGESTFDAQATQSRGAARDGYKQIGMLLLLLLLLMTDQIVAGERSTRSCGINGANGAEPDAPSVHISLVTIEPTETYVTGDSKEPVATVTVQIHRDLLPSEQCVVLEVGTYSTDPPGVRATYDPAAQVVRLLPGKADVVVVRGIKISQADIGVNSEAKVVIAAFLTHHSQGVRIENNEPGLSKHKATLIIRQK